MTSNDLLFVENGLNSFYTRSTNNNVINPGMKVYSIDTRGTGSLSPIESVKDNPEEDLIKITLLSGRSVTMKYSGYLVTRTLNTLTPIRCKDLTNGDRIAVVTNSSCSSYIDTYDGFGLTYSFGKFIGDLCIRSLIDKQEGMFTLETSSSIEEICLHYNLRAVHSKATELKIMSKSLANLFFIIDGSITVPIANISNINFVSGILSSIFSTFGNISERNHYIYLTSRSKTFLEFINMLLTRFNIFAQFVRDMIIISNRNIYRFFDSIPLDKNSLLLDRLQKVAMNYMFRNEYAYEDVIPGISTPQLPPTMNRCDLPSSYDYQKGIYFDRIIAITLLQPSSTFTIQTTNPFHTIANGIIIHSPSSD